jgi:mannose-6-phosphate isomerase-like protein (cupin superfamily)
MDVFDISTTPTKIVTNYGETSYELVGRTVAPNTAAQSVAYVTIDPQKASRRHLHRLTEESCNILAGEAFVEIGDESMPLRAGQIVLIPVKSRTRSTMQFGRSCHARRMHSGMGGVRRRLLEMI